MSDYENQLAVEDIVFGISSSSSSNEEDDDGEDEDGRRDRGSDEDEDPPPLPRVNGVPFSGTLTTAASEILLYVTKALKSRKNLLVECPPTLNRRTEILRSVLEYYKWRKWINQDSDREAGNSERLSAPDPSRIYLGVENFSDVKRVMEDIKKTFASSGHLRGIKMTVLAPRENLCRNTEINGNDGTTVERECHKLVRNYRENATRGGQELVCSYYANSKENDQLLSFIGDQDHLLFNGVLEVRDMEDFISHAEERHRCPYFDNRSLHSRENENADLIICPVQILLSPVKRQEYDVQLKDSILIIDDGHDIENLCLEDGSVTLTYMDLGRASTILHTIIEEYNGNAEQRPFEIEQNGLQAMSGLVEPLQFISSWVQQYQNAYPDELPSKDKILGELRSRIGLNAADNDELCDTIQRQADIASTNPTKYEILTKLRKFLGDVFFLLMKNSKDYNLKVTNVYVKVDQSSSVKVPALKIVCGNAEALFSSVGSPTLSVIVGGDCLSPISTLKTGLGIVFHDVLQVRYPLDSSMNDRYFLGYCSRVAEGQEFELRTKYRGGCKPQVAQAILELCEVIPNGVIILFHSRAYFKEILTYLREEPRDTSSGSYMSQIQRNKHIINRYKMVSQIQEADDIEEYKRLSERPEGTRSGAVLFVDVLDPVNRKYRLKNSEIRGVIHVSIPFREWDSHIIESRRKYLENLPAEHSEHDGNYRWYWREALRRFNQAFGRCVQNERDWGVVVLLYNRLRARMEELDELLPAWVSNMRSFRHLQLGRLVERIQQFVTNSLNDGDSDDDR